MKPTRAQQLAALEYLQNNNDGIVGKDGKIDRRYNGYISALGGCIVQSGVLSTAMMYHKTTGPHENGDSLSPAKAWNAVFTMYCKANGLQNNVDSVEHIQNTLQPENFFLAEYRLARNLMQIASALKMAIRTYELKDADKDDENLI